MKQCVAAAWWTITTLALLGCGADETEAVPVGGSGGSQLTCPASHIEGPAGGCMPVGIQGCDELFVEDDGFCQPAMGKCPAGTVPQFDEGCVPVGIQGCPAIFMEPDGLCHPSMASCPAGTFAVPLEGCVPIDGADGCGAGTWGNIPDGPNTIWVDPSYVDGTSDGSQQQPFSTIADAIAAAPSGGRVALAAGDYDEPVTIDQPLEMVGRCPSMVTISGAELTPYFSVPAIVCVHDTEGVGIRGVHIGGDGIGLLAVRADVSLSGVHINGATAFGVIAALSALQMEHVLIAHTAPDPSGAYGWGVQVQQNTDLVVDASTLVDNRGVALLATDDGDMVVTNTLVSSTGSGSPAPGRGIEVLGGARFVLDQSALVDNRDAALHVADTQTTVAVTECLFADTGPRESNLDFGAGANVQEGASLSLSHSALVANHDAAFRADGPGTTASIHASLIAHTLPQQSDLRFGLGAAATAGAHLTMTDSTLTDNHAVALSVAGVDTTASVDGCLIANTWPQQSDLDFGRGIDVLAGANLALAGSAVRHNREIAVRVASTSLLSTLSVASSLIEHTQPQQSDLALGVGIVATAHAELTMVDSALRQNHAVGALVTWGAHGDLSGVLVDQVMPGLFHDYDLETGDIVATYDDVGDGLVVAFDSSFVTTDMVVRGASRAGLVFDSATGELIRTRSRDCRFGLVLQGEPKPNYSDPLNVFSGSEKDILTDGALPVPEPPPMPQEP